MRAALVYLGIVGAVWLGLAVVAWKGPSVEVLVALVAFASSVTGAAIAAASQLLQFHLSEKARSKGDDARKGVLLKMLDCDGWRKLDTLTHVIGADEETTKRLLIEVGARASETGKPIWALIARKPLPEYDPAVTDKASN